MVLADFRFQDRPVEILSAYSGAETVAMLRERSDIALVLLDVVMEGEHSGLEVVRCIREDLDNRLVRIVLRTGQPGQAPAEQVVRIYDINDYQAKTEMTAQRLTITVITALRTWENLRHLDRQRRGLEHIITSSALPSEHRSQRQFMQAALERLGGLLRIGVEDGGDGSLDAVAASREGDTEAFLVIGGTGRFVDAAEGMPLTALLPPAVLASIGAMADASRQICGDDWIVCHHRVSGRHQLVVYVSGLDCPAAVDSELIRIHCLHTALLLDNLRHNEALRREVAEHLATAGELQRYRDQLKELVRERTAELEAEIVRRERLQGELIAARDQAEAANSSKSGFLARMSHEVRTPLHGILGMLRLLQDGPLSGEQRSYAGHAQRSGEMMLDLINDILDISKIEAGRIELEAIPFDLRETIEDVGALLAQRAAQRDLELVVDYPAGVPVVVVGDPARLRQVITNLVANAVKFTERGHVLVAINAAPGPAGRSIFTIRVADTGIGIGIIEQQRLFQEFVQADVSTHRRFGGTGLGLVISRQLLTLMGGSLALESVPGQGSVFTASVPLAMAGPDAAPPARGDLTGKVFLVADGLAVARKVLCRTLTSVGGYCVEADSVGAAVERLRAESRRFATIVSAQRFPDGKVLDLLLHLAPAERRPLVLVQAAYDGSCSRELRDGGVGAIVPRALVASSLVAAVTALLAGETSMSSDEPLTPFNLRRGARDETGSVITGKILALRVLLAEDNLVNQKVAMAMLTRFGCQCTVAGDGVQTLALMEAGPFDILLLDCNLPVVSGWEVVRRIREREMAAGGHLPVIALTANTMPGDRETCLAAGMDGYLAKPFDPQELRQVLQRHLPPGTLRIIA
jgi:signal transduction histidine kinase/DNA-binding response OmpR family regulator